MTEGRVVNVKHSREGEYVGRGTKWGNPFRIGWDGNREEVIARFEAWIKTKPELMAALPELRGKVLACHCAPLQCHANVLLKLAAECAAPERTASKKSRE